MDRITCIAKVCHEANRAYCATLGDNSQTSWEDAPEWQKQSAINGIKFHLKAHDEGRTTAASASHDSWLEEKRVAGWKYGPVKDTEKKEHPCFIPYEGLPTSQKLKDYIFGAIVKAYYEAQLQGGE